MHIRYPNRLCTKKVKKTGMEEDKKKKVPKQ